MLFAAKQRPGWLEASTILGEAGGLPDSAAGWRKYGACLAFLAEDEPTKKALVAQRLSRGWCVGTGEFKGELRRQAAERGAELDRFAGLDPDEARAERHEAWEESLRRLARLAKVDLRNLPAKKSAEPKALLAAAMKRTTSVSNRWLAERLDMGASASASQFARRFVLHDDGARQVGALVKRLG